MRGGTPTTPSTRRKPPDRPGAAAPRAARALAALLLALVAAPACEPPLTGAAESLAVQTAFRDLADEGACLSTRFLTPRDSAMSPLLETALRERGVPLYREAGVPDTGVVVVAVSPVRELDGALGLEAAVARTVLRDGAVRRRWTEWTYRLRCGPGDCTIQDRTGPRRSEEEVPESLAAPVRRTQGGRCPG